MRIREGEEREMLSVNLDRVARSLCSAPADPVVAAAVTAIAAAVNLIDKDMWHTHVNYAFISCADSFTHTHTHNASTHAQAQIEPVEFSAIDNAVIYNQA